MPVDRYTAKHKIYCTMSLFARIQVFNDLKSLNC